jgi:uncharacterized membrane protein YhaH (DUF805 family)
MLFSTVGLIAAHIIDGVIGGPVIYPPNIFSLATWRKIYWIFSLALFLPSMSVTVRRLHDMDQHAPASARCLGFSRRRIVGLSKGARGLAVVPASIRAC